MIFRSSSFGIVSTSVVIADMAGAARKENLRRGLASALGTLEIENLSEPISISRVFTYISLVLDHLDEKRRNAKTQGLRLCDSPRTSAELIDLSRAICLFARHSQVIPLGQGQFYN